MRTPVKAGSAIQAIGKLSAGQYQSLDTLSPVVHALATEQFDNYVKRVHVFIAPDRKPDIQLTKEQLAEELILSSNF